MPALTSPIAWLTRLTALPRWPALSRVASCNSALALCRSVRAASMNGWSGGVAWATVMRPKTTMRTPPIRFSMMRISFRCSNVRLENRPKVLQAKSLRQCHLNLGWRSNLGPGTGVLRPWPRRKMRVTLQAASLFEFDIDAIEDGAPDVLYCVRHLRFAPANIISFHGVPHGLAVGGDLNVGCGNSYAEAWQGMGVRGHGFAGL